MNEKNTIVANEGMYLTNGEIYAKKIVLADWDSPDNYREVPKEEYEKMLEVDAEMM